MRGSGRMVFETNSPEQTIEFGRRLGQKLERGDVLALVGPLGAGKTQLVKGLARGVGSDDRVTSPTFKLVSEYDGRVKLYHIDAYRLQRAEDLLALGCEELFDGDGAAVVEWADRVEGALPHLRGWMDITGPVSRKCGLRAGGPRAAQLLRGLN